MRTNLDLNLLVALNALLEERHVTRAARRVRLSQPAMSDCLRRLRRHYNDPLLTRVGNHLELTALGVILCEPAAAALDLVEQTFAVRPGFDPEHCEREFVVHASDYAVTFIGAELTRRFSAQAPRASLQLLPIMPGEAAEGERRLRNSDGMIMPVGIVDGLPTLEMFRDEWVCVVDADNTVVGERLTTDAMASLPWIVCFGYGCGASSPVLRQLRSQNIEANIDIVVGDFHSVPVLLAGTNRMAMMPHRLAAGCCDGAKLRMCRLPYDGEPLVEAFFWHSVHQSDPAHVWFRGIIQETCDSLA